MKNKKGFTLIELLAVIVILAILLIIAIPKILDVISNARASAWVNSTGLIKHAIEVNTQTPDPTSGQYRYTVKGLCDNETSSDVDVTNNIKNIAKVGDMNINCKKNTDYIFTLNGENKFSGRVSTITCDASGKCSSNIVSNEGNSNFSGNISSNPYQTRFDGSYAYVGLGSTTDTENGWPTEFNSEWTYYLRKDLSTNKEEACTVFSGGTVCAEYGRWDCGEVVNGECSNQVGYVASKKAEVESLGVECDLTTEGGYGDVGMYCTVNYGDDGYLELFMNPTDVWAGDWRVNNDHPYCIINWSGSRCTSM